MIKIKTQIKDDIVQKTLNGSGNDPKVGLDSLAFNKDGANKNNNNMLQFGNHSTVKIISQ